MFERPLLDQRRRDIATAFQCNEENSDLDHGPGLDFRHWPLSHEFGALFSCAMESPYDRRIHGASGRRIAGNATDRTVGDVLAVEHGGPRGGWIESVAGPKPHEILVSLSSYRTAQIGEKAPWNKGNCNCDHRKPVPSEKRCKRDREWNRTVRPGNARLIWNRVPKEASPP